MAEWKKSLEGMVGKKGLESLSKAIHRRDSDSTIGPLDVYLPLLVVPRTILSWLIQNIKPLPVGESKSLQFPGMEDLEIKVTKQGRDSYRGEFVRDGKVIHTFEKQTLPNVGGNLMTIGELYEVENKEESAAKPSITPDMTMPHVMMQMMAPIINQSQTRQMDVAVMNSLTASIGKLVDALVSNKITEQNVESAIASVKEPAPVKADESEGVTVKEALEETPAKDLSKDLEQDLKNIEIRRLKTSTSVKKAGDVEGPSGQAKPVRPDGVNEPIKPSKEPQTERSYFRQRLNRAKGIEKKEQEYHIAGHEIYTPCVHCGVPEFEKTEAGPSYKPCACFSITLKSKEGGNSFVHVIKKKEGGYSLVFNENADKEIVETLLLTLRNRLLEYKDSLT